MCKLHYFVQTLNYSCSICILTVISLERYLAINHPMLNRRHFSRTRFMRVAVISTVWLTCIIYSLPFLLNYDVVTNLDGNDDDPDADAYCMYLKPSVIYTVYIVVDFLLLYVAPMSLMTFVYAKISIVLWRTSGQPSGTPTTTSDNQVQLATICRSLSDDARRTRTVRGGSLRNPSALQVPPCSGACSSATESSGSQIGDQLTATDDSSRGSRQRHHHQLAAGGRSRSAAVVCRVHWDVVMTSERHARRKSESSMLFKAVPSAEQYGGNVVDALVDVDVRPTVVIDKWDRDDMAALISGRQSRDAAGCHANNHRFPQTSAQQPLRNHNNQCCSPCQQCHNCQHHHQHHRHHHHQNNRMLLYDDVTRISPPCKLTSGPPIPQRNSTVSAASQQQQQQTPLNGRRRVIRLLIMFVVCFAVCMLPHHIRLMWELCFGPEHFSDAHVILTPLTSLMFYSNSCFNPFLYALVSEKFRKAVSDVFCSLWRKHLRRRKQQQQQLLSASAAAVADGVQGKP